MTLVAESSSRNPFSKELFWTVGERVLHGCTENLNDFEVFKCREVCKAWRNFIENLPGFSMRIESMTFQGRLSHHCSLEMVMAFGGARAIMALPELQIDPEREVGTDIDFFTPEDLGEHAIYRGIDPYNRAFLVIGYRVQSILDSFFKNYVTVFFQRYSYNAYEWTMSGQASYFKSLTDFPLELLLNGQCVSKGRVCILGLRDH